MSKRREVADSINYQKALGIDITALKAFGESRTRAELASVAVAFLRNIDRVIHTLALPVYLIFWAKNTQISECVAYFTITGDVRPKSPPDKETYDKCAAENLRLHIEWLKTREADPFPNSEFGRASNAITGAIMDGGTASVAGFRAMLVNALVGTWTAFETLSGDLWEAALNCHPHELSQFNGKPKGHEEWKVASGYLHKHGYDLTKVVGTVLKNQKRYSFGQLSDIKKAYKHAFSKGIKDIDAIIGSDLRALEVVRNLLVHRAGIVDEKFIGETKNMPRFSGLKVNDELPMTGDLVATLLSSTIGSSLELYSEVERWLASH